MSRHTEPRRGVPSAAQRSLESSTPDHTQIFAAEDSLSYCHRQKEAYSECSVRRPDSSKKRSGLENDFKQEATEELTEVATINDNELSQGTEMVTTRLV